MKHVTTKKIDYSKECGERLDKFLSKEFFLNTRGEIIRNIKSGNILVNNKEVKPSYILKKRDKIELRIRNKELREEVFPNPKIKLAIIYQDENIIVLNKPAGIQVHPDHNEKENTVVNALINKFPEITAVGDDPELRPGIVHRLDKDTSGVLVVARNQKTFSELKNAFQTRKIAKKYLAVVFGRLEEKEGIINKPLARSSNYKKQVIAGKKTKSTIREALTEFRVLEEFNNYTLVELSPKTGRTHQIRIHLTSIGHPIVGDKLYKSKKYPSNYSVKRQLLHAKSLQFELSSQSYNFEAPLPSDFQEFLKNCRLDDPLDVPTKKG